MHRRLSLATALLGVALHAQPGDIGKAATALIARNCLGCHNATPRMGGLVLISKESALKGGKSGSSLANGRPEDSLLYRKVQAGQMPMGNPLPAADRDLVRRWIEAGADDSNPLVAAYARNCILARRLLERNVRFVQLFCGSRASGVEGLLNWDSHKTLKADYERHMPVLDKPTAGLILDLKARGLLKDTLVLWATEFGRMPTHQAGTVGRDHNPDAFTIWMLGAGVKRGESYGATDEFGRRAAESITTVHDFYATVLHLLGLDHEKLTFYHNGVKRRLTDVHGHVIHEILS